MKDIMDYLKKNLGLEEEEGNDDQETIIVPEHSFYEIVLMKAHNLDEFDYALAQVLEEKNPIIMDISILKKNSTEDFKLAGEKLKAFRDNHGGEAILLCKNGRNIIIVTPAEIKLIRK